MHEFMSVLTNVLAVFLFFSFLRTRNCAKPKQQRAQRVYCNRLDEDLSTACSVN